MDSQSWLPHAVLGTAVALSPWLKADLGFTPDPGLRLKPRSKAYIFIFFFSRKPIVLRIRLLSDNPPDLHEKSNECMGKHR